MGIIHQPHDKFFKETMSNRETAKDFLQQYLPQAILEVIDLEALAPEKDSFIESGLQEAYSDMLYKTVINGHRGYIYFLFEHKSYRSPKIALQLLKYMINIWEQKTKEKADELPIIIPLVIYHGEEAWQIPLNFSGIIKGANTLSEQVKVYIPDYRYLLYDLSPHGQEEIKGSIKLRIFLEILASILSQDLEEFRFTIRKALVNLDQLGKAEPENMDQELKYLETLIIYVMNVRDDLEMADVEQISQDISLEGREKIMTLAERLLQEGIQKGIQEGIQKGIREGIQKGIQEGKRQTATNLLKLGLSLEQAVEATELSVDEVLQLQRQLAN